MTDPTSATSITVRVPMATSKRGGRRVIIAPDGSVLPGAARQATTTADPALPKVLARAEKLDRTYVGDVLRRTLLASEIVEAIVGGRQSAEMTLPVLLKPFPVEWEWQ